MRRVTRFDNLLIWLWQMRFIKTALMMVKNHKKEDLSTWWILGPDHVQVFCKHKCFGNISQLETRPLIGWSSGSTNQSPGFQLTYVSKTLMLTKRLHMIRPYMWHVRKNTHSTVNCICFLLSVFGCIFLQPLLLLGQCLVFTLSGILSIKDFLLFRK